MASNYHVAGTELWMCGYNSFGQLGDGTTSHKSSPVQTVAGGTNWEQVSIGGNHTGAIKTDGTLWLWGYNGFGQLGDNTAIDKSSPVQTIVNGHNWKQVAVGDNATAAIKTDGTLWMCGYDAYGQLGDNTIVNKSSPVQTVAGGTTWKYVAVGGNHTAAIKTDGRLWTWGLNTYGQLGDNTLVHKSSPVQTVAGGTNWYQVSAGDGNTAAIKTDGTLWAWGTNTFGQLGDNTQLRRSSPVQTIAGGTNWKYVSISGVNTGAIKTDGTLWTWGYNIDGQLGDNTIVHKSSPVQTVAGGTNWKYVSMSSTYTRAVDSTNRLWTCGYNTFGSLGDNTTAPKSSPVQTVAGGTNWVVASDYNDVDLYQASLGLATSAGIDFDDLYLRKDNFVESTLWTWGQDTYGQLGINSILHRSSPVQTVAGGTNWRLALTGVSAYHNSAIKTDGSLWGWGLNTSGQLGDNTIVNKSSPVQTVAGGTNWKYVSIGGNHTSAIKTDGTLWTWGSNTLGELGDNTSVGKSSPVQTVAGGTNWKYVACGTYHTAAIKTDGTLWTWGYNVSGQLGDNTVANKSSPVQTVAGGAKWKHVSSGGNHTAAIKTDGSLWGWGLNTSGQLGDNTVVRRSSPVQTVAGGTNWKYVSAGYLHIIALKEDLL